MNRTCRLLGLLIVLMGLLLSPVYARGAANAPVTVRDDHGALLTLNATPHRLISLAPNVTEIFFALGLGPEVVAVSSFTTYPPSAVKLPAVIDYNGIKTEQIVALKPDLIVAAGINAPYVAKLRALHLPVLVTDPTDIPGILRDITLIGSVTGATGKAATLVGGMQKRLSAVRARVAHAAHPRVFYEIDNSYYTAGKGSFVDALITLAGGTNIAGSINTQYPKISAEKIISSDPQDIILGDTTGGVTPKAVEARPGWNAISAVKLDQVYGFNDDLASRAGPRIVDGLEALAHLIHPELFR